MTKKEQLNQRIQKHANELEEIFCGAMKTGVDLCKAVRRLEVQASRYTLALCNGYPQHDYETAAKKLEAIEEKLKTLLGLGDEDAKNIGLFINQDPRGYALKIDSDKMNEHNLKLHKDWGGNGIIAPDLREES